MSKPMFSIPCENVAHLVSIIKEFNAGVEWRPERNQLGWTLDSDDPEVFEAFERAVSGGGMPFRRVDAPC